MPVALRDERRTTAADHPLTALSRQTSSRKTYSGERVEPNAIASAANPQISGHEVNPDRKFDVCQRAGCHTKFDNEIAGAPYGSPTSMLDQ
jgi:hypothetical protein